MILGNSKILKSGGLIFQSVSTPPIGGSVLLQTVRINLDSAYRNITATWNMGVKGNTTSNLLNSVGVGTGFNLIVPADGGVEAEDEGVQTDPEGIFPSSVLQYMLNRGNSAITMQLTGLSPTKKYRFHFAAVQSYTDAGDKTSANVNGVISPLNGPDLANVVYKATVNIVNPTSGIADLTFTPDASGGYSCMNAFYFEEYS